MDYFVCFKTKTHLFLQLLSWHQNANEPVIQSATVLNGYFKERRSAGAKLRGVWIEGRLLNYRGFVGQQQGKQRHECAKYWSLLSLHRGPIVMHGYHSDSPHSSLWKWSLISFFSTLLVKWQENASQSSLHFKFVDSRSLYRSLAPVILFSSWSLLRTGPRHRSNWTRSCYTDPFSLPARQILPLGTHRHQKRTHGGTL